MARLIPSRRAVTALSLAVVAGLGLSACETEYGPERYSAYEAGAPARVEQGVVVGFRPVTFGGQDTGAGTAIGAVGGGVFGASVAGHGSRAAGGIAGAVLGALAGNAIERSNREPGFVYVVRFRRDATEVEIPQPDRYPIAVGTRVFVSYGARVRVTPMGGGYAPPPPSGYSDAPPPPPLPPRY